MDKKANPKGDALTDLALVCLFVLIGISYPAGSPLFIICIVAAIAYFFSSDVAADALGISLQFKNGVRLFAYAVSALAMIVFLFDLVSQVKLF